MQMANYHKGLYTPLLWMALPQWSSQNLRAQQRTQEQRLLAAKCMMPMNEQNHNVMYKC